MWTSTRLEDTPDPGDKGIGLLELRAAGLRIPPTVVCHHSTEPGTVDIEGIFDHLGVSGQGTVIARSSLAVPRAAAAAVSGLYPSIRSNRQSIVNALDEVLALYSGRDREIELQMAAGRSRVSSGMSVLVQPFIDPQFSGVAHITTDGDGPQVRLGIVAGHLEQLVDGKVPGWQCRLTVVEFDEQQEIAVIADEQDVEEITGLPNWGSTLAKIHAELGKLVAYAGASREVEWAVQDDEIWFLQSQPLFVDGV